VAWTYRSSRVPKCRSWFPLARVDDIEAGFYVKEDGRVNRWTSRWRFAKGAHAGFEDQSKACPANGRF